MVSYYRGAQAPAGRNAEAGGAVADLESEPPTICTLRPPGRSTPTFSLKQLWFSPSRAIAGSHLAPAVQRPLFLPNGSRTKVDGLLQQARKHALTREAAQSSMNQHSGITW